MSNQEALNNASRSIDDYIEQPNYNAIPPQFLEKYGLGPGDSASTVYTNPATGGTYKYVRSTPLLDRNGNTIVGLKKNSWVFFPHDSKIIINSFDPSEGNLWVDDSDSYIVYVYNNGEIADKIRGWYALTTKKKGYDHFVIQTAAAPKDLAIIDPNSLSDDTANRVPGVILKQGFIYYNTTSNDLFVWNGETDDYGNPLGTETSPSSSSWIQITRRSLEPSDVDTQVETYYEQLIRRVADLEVAINAL